MNSTPLTAQQIKMHLIELNNANEEVKRLSKTLGMPCGVGVYTVSAISKILHSNRIVSKQGITEVMEAIIEDLPNQTVSALVGGTSSLYFDKNIRQKYIEDVEELVIKEMEKRKLLGRLKLSYIDERVKLNEYARNYIANNYIEQFFKSTNNLRDISDLFYVVAQTGYSTEQLEKFVKIIINKGDNRLQHHVEERDKLVEIRKYIKPEDVEFYDSALLALKLLK